MPIGPSTRERMAEDASAAANTSPAAAAAPASAETVVAVNQTARVGIPSLANRCSADAFASVPVQPQPGNTFPCLATTPECTRPQLETLPTSHGQVLVQCTQDRSRWTINPVRNKLPVLPPLPHGDALGRWTARVISCRTPQTFTPLPAGCSIVFFFHCVLPSLASLFLLPHRYCLSISLRHHLHPHAEYISVPMVCRVHAARGGGSGLRKAMMHNSKTNQLITDENFSQDF